MTNEVLSERIKNVEGTLAIEKMKIGKDAMDGIKKIASGKATCSDIVEALKRKYKTRA
jgi:hypothetical protein